MLALLASGRPAAAEEHWRVVGERAAPWQSGQSVRSTRIGLGLQFHRTRVTGPGVLECRHARYGATSLPAEGLFQGNLPAPAEASARALGIAGFPVAGFRLTCGSGIYEFHRIDADTLLLGLDNRILTLVRSRGALAPAEASEGRTQRRPEALR